MNIFKKIKYNGFTLIELMAVLVILGALASIAIPHYAEYKERAHEAQCESNRYHIELDERAYYVDHGSTLLTIDDRYKCSSGGTYVWLVSDPDDPDYPMVGCSLHYIGEEDQTGTPEEPLEPGEPEVPVEPDTPEAPPQVDQTGDNASDAIQELIDYVKGLGLNRGIENNMVSRLTSASEALEQGRNASAVDALSGFISYVEVQRGKQIPGNEAEIVISRARGIIGMIS